MKKNGEYQKVTERERSDYALIQSIKSIERRLIKSRKPKTSETLYIELWTKTSELLFQNKGFNYPTYNL